MASLSKKHFEQIANTIYVVLKDDPELLLKLSRAMSETLHVCNLNNRFTKEAFVEACGVDNNGDGF